MRIRLEFMGVLLEFLEKNIKTMGAAGRFYENYESVNRLIIEHVCYILMVYEIY